MRAFIAAGLLVLSLHVAAAAETLTQSTTPPTTPIQPPSGQPGALTPAPVPSVSGPTVAPADRTGNADDAGPINATPFSSDLAPGLSGNPAGRSVRQTAPTADPVPAPAGPN